MKAARTVEQLGYQVDRGVLQAIELLQTLYGAKQYRDSGHTKTSPTWIFELPHFGTEVGIRMNKQRISLFMLDRTVSGEFLSEILPCEKIEKRYPRDGKPADSIHRSKVLHPSEDKQCLLLNLNPEDLQPLFEKYFSTKSTSPAKQSTSSKVIARRTSIVKSQPTTEVSMLSDAQSDIAAAHDLPEQATERQAVIAARLGQGEFRNQLDKYWGSCAVTACPTRALLRASHIQPWRNSTNKERLNPYNGLLLSAHLDAAFDNGLISFDDRGMLLLHPTKLTAEESSAVGISSDMRLRKVDPQHLPFLAIHRSMHGFS